jgi:tetratricopeptide (TPR) repeat protein
VVELSPSDAEAWEHLGTWREEEGRLDDAIAAYQKAVELSPDTPSLKFSLAEILRDAERYDEAAATYRGLIDEFRNAHDEQGEEMLADAYTGLASTQNLAGKYQDAQAVASEFLLRFPEHPDAFYEQASAYDAQGKHEEAIKAYERALEGDPLNAGIYSDLAQSYLAVNRPNDAVETAENAIALDSEYAAAYDTLAQALLALGRRPEAEEALQRAAELHAAEGDEEEPGGGM